MQNNPTDLVAAKTPQEFLKRFSSWQPDAIYRLFRPMDLKMAKAFLARFIEVEREQIEDIRENVEAAGLRMDYSLDTLPHIMKWMLRYIRATRVPVPDDWTAWLKERYQDGLLQIDENSKSMFLHATYYLGESFVRANQSLKWSTGMRKMRNLTANMPVVHGFTNDELAPLIFLHRVFLDILDDGLPDSTIDQHIERLMIHLP